jgi:sugar phosphate isomerase/epimerase
VTYFHVYQPRFYFICLSEILIYLAVFHVHLNDVDEFVHFLESHAFHRDLDIHLLLGHAKFIYKQLFPILLQNIKYNDLAETEHQAQVGVYDS